MSKGRVKKAGTNLKQPRTQIKSTAPTDASKEKADESESAFDFGGLPNRDLKKNLGCG
jgi:hypothetical protein